MKKLIIAVILGIIFGIPGLSNAVLVDNGGGFIYDTDLDITWYDFSYNGSTQTGATWNQAVSWANALTIGGVNGWRLPSTVDGLSVDGYDGTTTGGYAITTSEMGHLFYTELDNKAYYDVNGNYQPDHGLVNEGPFTTLQTDHPYWSGTEYSLDTDYAWSFSFGDGYQHASGITFSTYALAVHDGNVGGAAVPEPATMLLFGSGLLGLFGFRRKMRK